MTKIRMICVLGGMLSLGVSNSWANLPSSGTDGDIEENCAVT